MAHKRRRQKRIFKNNPPSVKHRATHLNSKEAIQQFYEGLSSAEQEGLRQDAAAWIEEREGTPDYPPNACFVDAEEIEAHMSAAMRSLEKQKIVPKEGQHLTSTTEDGYRVEILAVATQMPTHPVKGKPVAMRVGFFDPIGRPLLAKDKSLEPRYEFPEDITRVQSLGNAEGLRALPVVLTEAELPDDLTPDDSVRMKDEYIKHIAEGVSYAVASCEERPIANEADLFYQHFEQGFIAGFKFGLYAYPKGLAEFHSSLAKDRYRELTHRFAWEHFVKEPSPDKDALITSALDQLDALYEEYQSAV